MKMKFGATQNDFASPQDAVISFLFFNVVVHLLCYIYNSYSY